MVDDVGNVTDIGLFIICGGALLIAVGSFWLLVKFGPHSRGGGCGSSCGGGGGCGGGCGG